MLHGQKNNDHNFARFIDSAYIHIDEESISKTQAFLDSIPKPLEKHILGRLADYYYILALIQSDTGQYAKLYPNYVLALDYAEKENNYSVGGKACIELFSNIYFVKKDSTAYRYLEKAKEFYTLDNYEHGLLEIEQMYAYVKYLDHEYKNCNELLLPHLKKYKNVKDDPYYYMFALYMLTENYIQLEDFYSAHYRLKEFQTLKDNPTIVKYNYFSFEAGIYLSLSKKYSIKKQIDSSSHYLNKATKLRKYMGSDLVREYLGLKADFYKTKGNISDAQKYLDSLTLFEKEIFRNMVDASYEINEPLLNTASELASEKEEKFKNGLVIIFLVCLLIVLGIIYIIYYRKQKVKIHHYSDKIDNFSYLKTNNEKLTGKVRGLEDYIINLKKEIKEIASVNELLDQKERIKELYKSLHVNSSTLLDKSENHLELVNDLNVQFFKQIKLQHPELNDADIITCYYLYMGFKTKEIALFLNISVRALESKRYRIAKKINLNTKEVSLLEHLQDSFSSQVI